MKIEFGRLAAVIFSAMVAAAPTKNAADDSSVSGSTEIRQLKITHQDILVVPQTLQKYARLYKRGDDYNATKEVDTLLQMIHADMMSLAKPFNVEKFKQSQNLFQARLDQACVEVNQYAPSNSILQKKLRFAEYKFGLLKELPKLYALMENNGVNSLVLRQMLFTRFAIAYCYNTDGDADPRSINFAGYVSLNLDKIARFEKEISFSSIDSPEVRSMLEYHFKRLQEAGNELQKLLPGNKKPFKSGCCDIL
ncbi:hypothetical protein JCM33374_g665 [Metschnikowia sp. JCM 33374]|nr:hypothetical protein JCM33374_g665 [Metschnikowia sp. JCM 33374]